MPEYLAPGVFIEEIERGPKPIEGVATSTAAFLGPTERGPVKPTFIASYHEYLRRFGDIFVTEASPDNYMPYAVRSFFDNGGRRCYIARILGDGAAPATVTLAGFTINSLGPGSAYNRIWVRIGPGTTLDGSGDEDEEGKPIGFRLQVYYWDNHPTPFDPTVEPTPEAPLPGPLPSVFEDFDDLSLDPNSQSYYAKRVNNGNSAFVELIASDTAAVPEVDAWLGAALAGGDDGAAPNGADYVGLVPDPSERTGLSALDLDSYREVAIVHAPHAGDAANDVAKAVITHCENNRFRFAVIDSDSGIGDPASLKPRSALADSQYAALYYPWITISDPRSGGRKNIPPGGSVCGIYALTDNARGVYKAPANETIAGAVDLEYDISTGLQEVLNPKGVNAIRRFPGRGIRVWGARTLSSDPLWKYVNVRRFMIFIEASIFNSTQWVVFEPNNERLWARVQQTVTLFLRDQWREGALLGATEEEAFSVAVGRETMTEDDILNGRLIVEVGVAPVRPAEFVVFRVFQKTQEARA